MRENFATRILVHYTLRPPPTSSTLTALGLIDEYRFILNPLLQGGGTRLFSGDYPRTPLQLQATRRFASGAAVLYYRPSPAG